MITDPGLAMDLCPYIESVSGDGGNHATTGQWWLSPDIALTGPISGADQADANKPNPVVVTAHLKAACTPESDATSVLVELWIGNPALAMTPNHNTRQIGGTLLIPLSSFVSNKASKTFTWTPPSGAVDPDPEAPGHKCLIARVYTNSATAVPDGNDFHLPDDQHSAQHNIAIVAAPMGKKVNFNISTGNPFKAAQKVTIHVNQDLKPTGHVLAAIEPSLKRLTFFRTFATRPTQVTLTTTNLERHLATELMTPAAPSPVATHLAEVATPAALEKPATAPVAHPATSIQIVSNFEAHPVTGLFGLLNHPNLQAIIPIKPLAFDTFTLNADLTHAAKGEALVYHLNQTGSDNKQHGGLTVVFVAH
jgi:hypothetical protein